MSTRRLSMASTAQSEADEEFQAKLVAAASAAQANPDKAASDIQALVSQEYRNRLTMAAEEGDVEAQVSLAQMYIAGAPEFGFTMDEDKALFWCQKAAEANNAEALYLLARFYESGFGVRKDEDEAVKIYYRAADCGSADAQYMLGQMLEMGDPHVLKDESKAVHYYSLAADQAHSDAAYRLSVCYKKGKGVHADEDEALKWSHRAAVTGNLDACYSMGITTISSSAGDWQTLQRGMLWLERAADRGHTDAFDMLQTTYSTVSKTQSDRMKTLRPLAEQGDSKAQLELGRLYKTGMKDPDSAADVSKKCAMLFYQSATQSSSEGEYELARMYDFGVGDVSKHLFKAACWYIDSARQGNNVFAILALADLFQKGGTADSHGHQFPKDPEKVALLRASAIAVLDGEKTTLPNLDLPIDVERFLEGEKSDAKQRFSRQEARKNAANDTSSLKKEVSSSLWCCF
ncbi:uncharacterized protein BJ171DRAFT_598302 [Polychytrium aggregatum]|uniref:uncharacterized protein n=1 Tax=Polychytrium aggregatum TaxID=110093 RepID=UPI0022FF2FE8|nr:uncharacterized protein BJ171DRAFT_598302 [Polychytrium aggregatum]KAI9205641.1 hypothetical protein BJ171DRAFT_598302 [Polychytrium aggregatum]